MTIKHTSFVGLWYFVILLVLAEIYLLFFFETTPKKSALEYMRLSTDSVDITKLKRISSQILADNAEIETLMNINIDDESIA